MDKTYNPQSFEKRIYKEWLDKKYFASKPDKNKKNYTIVMPPPNVTGRAHVGHALNNTIQDILIRYKRMKGFEACWIPGTDHAAIATEAKVVDMLKKEGITKDDISREEFLKRGWEWYEKYGGIICDQLKELGISCDWDRCAFTMDENLNRAVKSVFVQYYNEGLIYKGTRVVNYCPKCRSSISDIENEHKEQMTNLWHMRYKLEDGSGEVVVATTRPETLFGDTAVAVNPNDKRYKNLIGKNVILPIVNRPIPIIADEYCEMEFGTGAVKITPAHDVNDYEIGLRHKLPIITVIDDYGKLNEQAGKFAGMDRIEVRQAIEDELKRIGALVKVEKYKNKVGCCCRCGEMTEPKISEQWFVKMKDLAKPAIDAVKSGELRFVPKRYEKQYLNWLTNIQDWCISRQLWLGHRIPIYTCEDCGYVEASVEDVKKCKKCGGKHIKQDNDVLDTWFSSALWPFSTLGYPEKTEDLAYYYPTDVLVTAYDIITFWVVRMVFSGLHFTGTVPFKDVVINGMVRDKLGRKMSKNLGNGIDPMDVIAEYGADSLRLSLVNGMSLGMDISYSTDKAKDSKVFINKLYNAGKFVLQNTEGMKVRALSEFKLNSCDKWILTKLENLIKSTSKNIEKYSIGVASANLIDFTVSTFCDWYVEASKLDLYGTDAEAKSKAQNILLFVFTSLLKLFHPFIPFVTEEIYQNLPSHEETIMRASFPEYDKKLVYKNDFAGIIEIIKEIRGTRAQYHIPDNKKIKINLIPNEKASLLKENLLIIQKLAGGSEVNVISNETEKSARIETKLCTISLPMGDLVDEAEEQEKLKKNIESLKFEIERSEKMLNNPNFVAKAPKQLVDTEREKLAKNKEFLEKLLKKG